MQGVKQFENSTTKPLHQLQLSQSLSAHGVDIILMATNNSGINLKNFREKTTLLLVLASFWTRDVSTCTKHRTRT
jgi:alanine racemase